MRVSCDDALLQNGETMKFSFQVEFMCWVCTVRCCLMLSCLVVSWLVLSRGVSWCLALSCVVLCCVVLVLAPCCFRCVVSSCVVLAYVVLVVHCLVLSCVAVSYVVLYYMLWPKKYRHDTSVWVCITRDTECTDLASSTMIKTTNRSNSVYMRRAKV